MVSNEVMSPIIELCMKQSMAISTIGNCFLQLCGRIPLPVPT